MHISDLKWVNTFHYQGMQFILHTTMQIRLTVLTLIKKYVKKNLSTGTN